MLASIRSIARSRISIAAALAVLLVGIVAVGQPTRVAADVSVNIMGFAFMPTPLTIPVGTTVTWVNKDGSPHTTTSDSGVWDSRTLVMNESYSFTFKEAGTFPYHCMIHGTMHGTVVVTPAVGAAPAVSAPNGAPQIFANPAFQQLWAQTDANPSGGSYVWGPGPFTGGMMEEYAEATAGKRLVQYFDKARMELNAPGGPVTAGLLSVELISGRQQNGNATFMQRAPAKVTVAGDPDNAFPRYADLAMLQGAEPNNTNSKQITRQINADGTTGAAPAANDPLARTTGYDDATKHNIPKAFVDFRNAPNLGGISAIGFAITEPVWANVKVNGKVVPVLIQAFERRVLTYTPDNPTLFRVEYGNIGRAYNTWRYGV